MRSTTRVRGLSGVLAASLAVALAATPAAAAAPQSVAIDSHVTFNPNGPNFGDFTASGDAVANGVLCADGTFVDTGIRFAGFQSGNAGRTVIQIQVLKTFTCTDGSGTFSVKLQIRADVDTGLETFTWNATGGTGAYTSLRGSGSGSTVRDGDGNGNTNSYSGFVLR